MEINLIILVILGFASYRLTRFFVIDTLIEGFRGKFQVFLSNKTGKLQFFWYKLLDLISCTFCLGFWISLAVYSLYIWESPLIFNQVDWINVFGVAGIQSLLHAFEPSDE